MTILAKIAGFFSSYLMEIALAAMLGVGAWGGVMQIERDSARREVQTEKGLRAVDKANATVAALTTTAQFRAKEQGWQAQITKSQGDYDALRTQDAQKLAAYAASSRAALADNGKLRGQLAAFAAGGSAAGQDTVAAASGRAAALGLLLADALRLDDEALLAGAKSAGAAESNGNAVRTLLKAWPHDDDSIGRGKP